MKLIKDLVRSIVKAEYGYFFGLFNNLYTHAASELSTTPENFATVGQNLVALVLELGKTVVMPIAAAILAYSLSKNLFELVNQHNNMADFDYFGFFKTLLKTGIAAYITANCFTFVMGFFNVGAVLVNQVAATTSLSIDAVTLSESLAASDDLGILCIYVLLGIIIGIIVLIAAAIILITIYTRLINIYILIVLAPIPFSTILGSGSLGQIGISYIKNILATALQGFIIAILMTITSSIISNLSVNVSSMEDLLIVSILLITCTLTISKSLSLAKTAVGLAG